MDTDNDQSFDYNEVMLCHTSPVDSADRCNEIQNPNEDTDGDGLHNVDERNVYGSSPEKADTDNDFLDGGTELKAWKKDGGQTRLWTDIDLDGAHTGTGCTLHTDSNLCDDDADNDGLLDGEENHNDVTGDATTCAKQSAEAEKKPLVSPR
jgi:hypothetical protein